MNRVTPAATYTIIGFISRSSIRLLLLVMLTTISQISAADEYTDDFRLFFPSVESATTPLTAVSEGTAAEDSSRKRSPPTRKSLTMQARVKLLRFNALVRNGNRILLLVNDLPCEIIYEESSRLVTDSIGVNCDHFIQKHYSIKLQPDNNTLLVYKNRKFIATLLVGQSL